MDDNTSATGEQPDTQHPPVWPPLPEATAMWAHGAQPPGAAVPPPPSDRSPAPRSWKIAVAVLAALFIAGGGTLVGVLLGGSGTSTQAHRPPSPSVRTGSQSAEPAAAPIDDSSTPAQAAPSVVTQSVYVTAQPSEATTPQGSVFSGPGGISVRGPAGWVRNDGANLSNIRDFIPTSSSCRLCGANIRIGVGNEHPKSTIEAEARFSIGYLRQTLRGYVSSPKYVSFRGTTAADIEWQFHNDDYPDVERRGIERVWIENGVTYEIVSSGLTSQWASAQQVFQQVVSSVRIS